MSSLKIFRAIPLIIFSFCIIGCIFGLQYQNPATLDSDSSNTRSGTVPRIKRTKNGLLCSFNPVVPSQSTPRDAIFTATTAKIERLLPLVKSIRTTGCKAAIVIFTTSDVVIPSELDKYKITVVSVGPHTTRMKKSPYKARWEWYYAHLLNYSSNYDRIFHIDAFDTFFQGDPFSDSIKQDTLYIQLEDRKIGYCPYTRSWSTKCHTFQNIHHFYDQTIACSGSLLGGAAPFKEFVGLMVNSKEWGDCWGKGYDQGDFNYILYEIAPKHPIKIEYMGCNSGFVTMHYCSSQSSVIDENGLLLNPDKSKPAVFVHQFNRYPHVYEKLLSHCT